MSSGKRPSDDMQRQSKRRPGEQLTKDNFEDDDDEPAVDPGTWGKADAATMARRKVIKVRRGAGGAPADQQAPAAAAADNPFAGVALAPTAANPFAGIAMTASAADQGDAQKAGEEQPPAAEAAASAAAEQADATPAAEAAKAPEVAKQLEAASPAAAAGATAAAAEEQPSVQEQQEAPKLADKPADTTGDQQAEQAGDKPADKAEDKPAAASTSGGFGSLAAGSTGGFGGIAGSTGGFGGFGSSTGGFAGFGAGGGFGGFAATAGKEGEGSGSLFGNFKAPPPGSSFGFGSAGGKPKDVEEGGEGEEGAEENGQELFGGPEVAPVVQLSEVPKQTGEEGESNVFAAEGKLYEYVDGTDWKERGRGELRLNVHQGNHRARLVMRQKGSQRLLLNANLYPKMPTSKMVGGKGATFAAVNAAPPVPAEGAAKAEKEGEGADGAAASAAASTTAMKTYAFKAKSAAEIDDFLAKVDQYKARSVESSAGEGDKQANPDGWGDQ